MFSCGLVTRAVKSTTTYKHLTTRAVGAVAKLRAPQAIISTPSQLRLARLTTNLPTSSRPALFHTSSLKNNEESNSIPPKPEAPAGFPPHIFLEALESTAFAPWLAIENTSDDTRPPEEKMKRAYSRIFQIVMYLGRPQDDAEQFLDDFEKATAEAGSDLARSRKAITILLGTIVRDMSSIPLSSPLRTKHQGIFDIFGALVPAYDMSGALQEDGEALAVPAWAEYWSRVQPVLLTLGMKLDEEGFGFDKREEGGKETPLERGSQ